MSRQLSNAAIQAAYSQETSEVFVSLLTITNPSFTEPIRLSSDNAVLLPNSNVRGTISNGIEYIYCPFTITLPQDDDTGIARATIRVDNIDRRITEAVRRATSAISVDIRIVLASSPDVIEAIVQDFRLEQVSYDALEVSGELSLDYYDLEPYSKLRFTPSGFPGLF